MYRKRSLKGREGARLLGGTVRRPGWLEMTTEEEERSGKKPQRWTGPVDASRPLKGLCFDSWLGRFRAEE